MSSALSSNVVAIDFGATNTDVVASIEGELRYWMLPSVRHNHEERIHEALNAGKLHVGDVRGIVITGGDRRGLQSHIDGIPIVMVNEMEAIGRGGLALTQLKSAAVVSAGSGTAVVSAKSAKSETFHHITGTGVGGGTLQGLAQLLIGISDPEHIDSLARRGLATGVNVTIGEIVGEAIGGLPADTTAVNFGKLASQSFQPRTEDLAAGLVNMVGQVIAVVGINAARSQGHDHLVVIGHLADLESIRTTIIQVGGYYNMTVIIPERRGFATALGALLSSEVGPNGV